MTCATVTPRSEAERREAEEALLERLESVKGYTKRWIEAILKHQGKISLLEEKWEKITWISLKEYLEIPGREEEWMNHPEKWEWI